jgi:excisionase family DNA binding protein
VSSYLNAVLNDLEGDPSARERLRALLIDESPSGLLTPSDAAERLGIHPKTLTRASAAGRVTGAVRVGRHWRFDPTTLALQPPAGTPLVITPTRRSGSTSAATAIRGEL